MNLVLRMLADENFNNNIVRGVLRVIEDADIVRVQDVGLSGADDPTVLEWAAGAGRVLLTHDVSTMTRYAYERATEGTPMPGVFEVARKVALSTAIEEVCLVVACSHEGEWEGQVRYLPLR